MLSDALENVDEVVVGVDVVQPAGDDQALDDADVFGREFGPAEEPVLPTHGTPPQGALEMVGIDRYVWIGQIDLQATSSLVGVGERLGQRIAR